MELVLISIDVVAVNIKTTIIIIIIIASARMAAWNYCAVTSCEKSAKFNSARSCTDSAAAAVNAVIDLVIEWVLRESLSSYYSMNQ